MSPCSKGSDTESSFAERQKGRGRGKRQLDWMDFKHQSAEEHILNFKNTS